MKLKSKDILFSLYKCFFSSDLIYKGLGGGNIDYNDLSQMSKETLDQIYKNLSTILHKGKKNWNKKKLSVIRY